MRLQAAGKATPGEPKEDLFGEAVPKEGRRGKPPALSKIPQKDVTKMLDDFFGKDEELAEDDLFLKKYIASRVSAVFF